MKSLQCEIIAVGTELLMGHVANTNAQFLSKELATLGISVYHHTVVGDNPARLKDALARAQSRANLILTTGGLGPTYDDLTKQTIAEAFGRALYYHQPTADRITHFFQKFGRTPTENNFQQAMLPEGSTVLENSQGTAPGCFLEEGETMIAMLPGPPRECQTMFTEQLRPILTERSGEVIVSRSLRIFGMGESAVESLLREEMEQMTNPSLAPYAGGLELELRITAKAKDEAAAAEMIAPVEARVKAVLGDQIYGVDVASLEEVCHGILLEKGLTIGTAESCTGGLLAKRLTDLPGASGHFLGSFVTYSPAAKTSLLGIPETLLQEEGTVSPVVAEEMAKHARVKLGCDLALSTTGVAGPGPDEKGQEAGLVYIALASDGHCFVKRIQVGFRSRDQVRQTAAQYALDLLRRHLQGKLSEQ